MDSGARGKRCSPLAHRRETFARALRRPPRAGVPVLVAASFPPGVPPPDTAASRPPRSRRGNPCRRRGRLCRLRRRQRRGAWTRVAPLPGPWRRTAAGAQIGDGVLRGRRGRRLGSRQSIPLVGGGEGGQVAGGSNFLPCSPAPDRTGFSAGVSIIEDDPREPEDTFSRRLQRAEGVDLVDEEATGTILSDDAELPAIAVADASRLDGTTAGFAVTVSGTLAEPATVEHATRTAVALSGEDYGLVFRHADVARRSRYTTWIRSAPPPRAPARRCARTGCWMAAILFASSGGGGGCTASHTPLASRPPPIHPARRLEADSRGHARAALAIQPARGPTEGTDFASRMADKAEELDATLDAWNAEQAAPLWPSVVEPRRSSTRPATWSMCRGTTASIGPTEVVGRSDPRVRGKLSTVWLTMLRIRGSDGYASS